jgi:hypothetical protein
MTTKQSLEAGLVERVERLERANRRHRLIVIGFSVAALIWAAGSSLLAAVRPGVVEASEFVLRDQKGAKRGELSVDAEGRGTLLLYGADGRMIAELPLRPGAFPLQR